MDSAIECARRDCAYHNGYTKTCDYTQVTHSRSPCPVEDCAVYVRREQRRTWTRWLPTPTSGGAPEPPEPGGVLADCGHEVYGGETLYTLPGGRTICPDCVADTAANMTVDELAGLLGCDGTTVGS